MSASHSNLRQRLAAETIGTALLLAAVVGSGIMGERLAGGNVAIALLANALATGAGLVALILTFGPTSGAHFNPVVSLAASYDGELSASDAMAYCAAQLAGAFAGVALAHAMFGETLFSWSTHAHSGWPQLLSEAVATFGLIATIKTTSRHRPSMTPIAVAAYITSAYWFTASTSFANPAVTLARSLTNTFAGIRAADVPGFVAAQIAGAILSVCVVRWLLRDDSAKGDAASRGR